MPMLTNNIHEKWRGDVVHRIINDPVKRERLINDLIRLLKANNFQGINIDFEELIETRNEVLSAFQKELYTKLHAQGLLVTQDVIPFNEDYDYKTLAAIQRLFVFDGLRPALQRYRNRDHQQPEMDGGCSR